MCHRFRVAAIVLLLSLWAHAEEAEELQQKGIDALNDSQTNPRAIVDAARNFARAAQAFAKAGKEEKSVEMNSYLYWCKKKMTMEDIDAFVKSGENQIVATLNAAADTKVDVNAAQSWLDRAESFATKNPNEHLLIAIRFFEVADRFKGTDISFQAQDRSLKEQTLALTQKPASKKKTGNTPKTQPPETTTTTVVEDDSKTEPIQKQPLPDAAKVKEAKQQLKEILKDEFAKTAAADKVALAKKLMTMAAEPNNDAVTKFAELQDAGELAASAGEVLIAMKAARKQDNAFVLDAPALKLSLLKTIFDANKGKDVAKAIAEAILIVIEEGIEADQYASLRALASLADSAATRAAIPELTAQTKDKAAGVDEIVKEWPAAKAALEKLATDPANQALCATVGKFNALMKGDMTKGLPLLAVGTDAVLKKLAESDFANPAESAAQTLLGDVWFDLAEKEKSKRAKLIMYCRAGFWYNRALGGAAGLAKVKLDKRLATIMAMPGAALKMPTDLSGKWTVSWSEHPTYGKRTCELQAGGNIVVAATENFGAYRPAQWQVRGKQVVIKFKNGESSAYKIVDENTFKQEDGGDAVYSRKK